MQLATNYLYRSTRLLMLCYYTRVAADTSYHPVFVASHVRGGTVAVVLQQAVHIVLSLPPTKLLSGGKVETRPGNHLMS